ncbi:MAG TPA: hypothetical protein DDX98_14330 [Bacteroidales bacterium]|jgi:hypothetical protein|nr:hypothetical protein [Bacteroidales bacterium]
MPRTLYIFIVLFFTCQVYSEKPISTHGFMPEGAIQLQYTASVNSPLKLILSAPVNYGSIEIEEEFVEDGIFASLYSLFTNKSTRNFLIRGTKNTFIQTIYFCQTDNSPPLHLLS